MKEEKKNSAKDKALTDKELSAVNGGAAGGLGSVTFPSAIAKLDEKAFGGAPAGSPVEWMGSEKPPRVSGEIYGGDSGGNKNKAGIVKTATGKPLDVPGQKDENASVSLGVGATSTSFA